MKPIELRDRAIEIGRLLRPHDVIGHSKRRVGSKFDGGYVLVDDFDEVKTAFSLGVETNADWDLEIAKLGILVHQFDYSVDASPEDHPNLSFHKAKIGTELDSIPLSAVISRYGGDRSNILMKMDIEHWEWPTLDATKAKDLLIFGQVACELHSLDLMLDVDWFERALRVLQKMRDAFEVVHVHANNTAPLLYVGGVILPCVLEVSWASRQKYDFAPSSELFPGQLDGPNDPNRHEYHLGSFAF